MPPRKGLWRPIGLAQQSDDAVADEEDFDDKLKILNFGGPVGGVVEDGRDAVEEGGVAGHVADSRGSRPAGRSAGAAPSSAGSSATVAPTGPAPLPSRFQ